MCAASGKASIHVPLHTYVGCYIKVHTYVTMRPSTWTGNLLPGCSKGVVSHIKSQIARYLYLYVHIHTIREL